MPMFTAALFTIVKRWKLFNYPQIDECVHKMWYVHSIEYYLGIKRNEVLLHATTQMNLENNMLNAISQTQKDKKIT